VGLSWEFHLSMGSFFHENPSYSHPGLGGRCVSPGRFECQGCVIRSLQEKKSSRRSKKVKDENKAEADGEQGRLCQARGMSMTSISSQP
jgi:hypothetical protein